MYLVLLAIANLLLLSGCRDLFDTHFPRAPRPDGSAPRTRQPVERYKGKRADRARRLVRKTTNLSILIVVVAVVIEFNIQLSIIKFPGGIDFGAYALTHDGFIAGIGLTIVTMLVWCLVLKTYAISARLHPAFNTDAP
jgi:hypothetical protein